MTTAARPKTKRVKWADLRAEMSPEDRAEVAAGTAALLAEMPLHDLRRARQLTQGALGDVLDMTQPEVSKIERRADMYVSTLRRYVEAMGGELEIRARFPDGDVRITQFADVDAEQTGR